MFKGKDLFKERKSMRKRLRRKTVDLNRLEKEEEKNAYERALKTYGDFTLGKLEQVREQIRHADILAAGKKRAVDELIARNG